MILYKLICKDCEISFDSWFSSSNEYEKLKNDNFLNCYVCDSSNIEKTLMTPSILRSKNDIKINKQDLKYKKKKKKISEYQNFLKKNLDYVGENFAYEARSMHYKNKKATKGIYGTANKEELKELKEEGIEVEMITLVKDITN